MSGLDASRYLGCEVSHYRGSPVILLNPGSISEPRHQFGLEKARLVLTHLPAIQQFVEEEGVGPEYGGLRVMGFKNGRTLCLNPLEPMLYKRFSFQVKKAKIILFRVEAIRNFVEDFPS